MTRERYDIEYRLVKEEYDYENYMWVEVEEFKDNTNLNFRNTPVFSDVDF